LHSFLFPVVRKQGADRLHDYNPSRGPRQALAASDGVYISDSVEKLRPQEPHSGTEGNFGAMQTEVSSEPAF